MKLKAKQVGATFLLIGRYKLVRECGEFNQCDMPHAKGDFKISNEQFIKLKILAIIAFRCHG